MKVCLMCQDRFDATGWRCPFCHIEPAQVAGFTAFAPQLMTSGQGYDPSFFSRLVDLEPKNFWFRARNELISWAVGNYFPNARTLLEIGCGTGFVLWGLQNSHPRLHLYGSEIHIEGLVHATKRLTNATLFQMDARQIPFEWEFDVVGAFDVLEHISEDEAVLGQMYQATRGEGGIIVTVPGHEFLWSPADEHAHHVRRYKPKDLVSKIERAGFRILRSTSFVSLLLPVLMASRIAQRLRAGSYDEFDELTSGGLVNASLEKALSFERLMIRAGVSFFAGGSLLVVAQKVPQS